MRRASVALLIALAGCAPTERPAALEPAAAVGACAAAVAAHVGKGTDAVRATWSGATADGGGMVTVIDAQAGGAERLHTCEVDAGGRVMTILHPGA